LPHNSQQSQTVILRLNFKKASAPTSGRPQGDPLSINNRPLSNKPDKPAISNKALLLTVDNFMVNANTKEIIDNGPPCGRPTVTGETAAAAGKAGGAFRADPALLEFVHWYRDECYLKARGESYPETAADAIKQCCVDLSEITKNVFSEKTIKALRHTAKLYIQGDSGGLLPGFCQCLREMTVKDVKRED
jgi:hypothetical protein